MRNELVLVAGNELQAPSKILVGTTAFLPDPGVEDVGKLLDLGVGESHVKPAHGLHELGDVAHPDDRKNKGMARPHPRNRQLGGCAALLAGEFDEPTDA